MTCHICTKVYPIGINVDRSDNIYINDGQYLHFEKFSPGGIHISEWNPDPKSNTISISLILHVDFLNNFYIIGAIVGCAQIEKFSSTGEHVVDLNIRDVVARSLSIDSDHDGNLYLFDDDNSKIVKLFADGSKITWSL